MSTRLSPSESLSDTTRSYPRTMHGVLAAFPDDPEAAHAMKKHIEKKGSPNLWIAMVLGCAVAGLVLTFWS